MKFQFKHQDFQADAAKSICDIFSGQATTQDEFRLIRDDEIVIGANANISLSDAELLHNLRGVQSRNGLQLNAKLDGKNFTVEMETGTGKTYTYIKTMYELNARYGWRKFMVVVPSVAIREGVKKTFEVTAEHFADEYHKKIRYFVYNSKNLERVKSFVDGAGIWAMIVNVQAFNSRSADNRRMLQELDEFQSRVPIEVIAQVRPIVIIDEPQSVEGEVSAKKIRDFNPLMTLRYSATHKNLYNLVYRLDARDAYAQGLVKKITVKGVEVKNDNASGFIFLSAVNLSKNNPTATVTFKQRGKSGLRDVVRTVSVKDNLYKLSNDVEAYRDGFIVTAIDGADNSLEFLNGQKIFVGQAIGDVNEEAFRRIQIRETIQSHLQREAELFGRGIKVLSLFFIDEVAKYRSDDGLYAKIFEQEYVDAVKTFVTDAAHQKYLSEIDAHETHAGYFSVDKKNRPNSDDVDAYDLIMRDKEKLLDLREPVRFIFSHSALREGWDNPNVFQICALKQGASEIRRRQEVGRGMRLCVNQNGERQDDRDANVLTVVANETFATFAAGLQRELNANTEQPTAIDEKFFVDRKRGIDDKLSRKIYNALIRRDYLDDDGNLTENFFADDSGGQFSLGAELETFREDTLKLLTTENAYKVEDARANNVTVTPDESNFNNADFQELWRRISQKTFYRVEFDSEKFIERAATAINEKLFVPETKIYVERGTFDGDDFVDVTRDEADVKISAANVQFDLVGKLVAATDLTRRDTVEILRRVEPKLFDGFNANPERFLSDAAQIINGEKSWLFTENIRYTPLDEPHDAKIFFGERTAQLNVNAIPTTKNVYSHLIYDSTVEKNFAAELERDARVSVYAKLPPKFLIPTPHGNYNPDWAIVFDKKFFVVETKGTSNKAGLSASERGKIDCAEKHFAALGDEVRYEFVKSFDELADKISRHAL